MNYLEVVGLAAPLLWNKLEFSIFIDPACAPIFYTGFQIYLIHFPYAVYVVAAKNGCG
jgi:hypothetical protein